MPEYFVTICALAGATMTSHAAMANRIFLTDSSQCYFLAAVGTLVAACAECQSGTACREVRVDLAKIERGEIEDHLLLGARVVITRVSACVRSRTQSPRALTRRSSCASCRRRRSARHQ